MHPHNGQNNAQMFLLLFTISNATTICGEGTFLFVLYLKVASPLTPVTGTNNELIDSFIPPGYRLSYSTCIGRLGPGRQRQ